MWSKTMVLEKPAETQSSVLALCSASTLRHWHERHLCAPLRDCTSLCESAYRAMYPPDPWLDLCSAWSSKVCLWTDVKSSCRLANSLRYLFFCPSTQIYRWLKFAQIVCEESAAPLPLMTAAETQDVRSPGSPDYPERPWTCGSVILHPTFFSERPECVI